MPYEVLNDGGGRYEVLDAASPAPLSRMDKLTTGLADPIHGGAQLLTKLLPDSVVNAGNSLNNWLADKTGLVPRLPDGGVDQQVRERELAYQQQRAASGESGFDGYRTIGNVLSPANLAIAARTPQAASLIGRVGLGAAGGAASGALSPVTEGDFTGEKLQQVGAAGVFGGGVPLVTSALSRVVSPKASVNPQVQLLKDEGVTPTIGQTLGGRWNALEEKAQSIPILGDAISMARRNAAGDFETAAHNRALAPIGQELPPGLSGRDAVNFTEGQLKDAYDATLAKIGAITPDQPFNARVSSLQQMVNGFVMPKAEKAKFASALSDVRQSIDANGVITPEAYKTLESSLGTDASKLGASTNIYEGKLAPAVKQLQFELRDMLQRQAGPAADELNAVNAGWANFKRVQNAAGKVGAEDGQFNPAQFLNAVRTLDKSKDKAAFARGSALGQDLGDAGKSVLGSKVPNSFTTDRAMIAGGALGSYMLNPAIPAGLLGAGAMYTSPMQSLLSGALTARPQSAQAVAESLRKTSPLLVPLGAQVGLGLLN